MQTTQVAIYRAANLEQAHLLKNLLQEQGIEAQVTNAMLQQAGGDLPLGGPIEPRLVVDASDAAPARRIALEFDQVVAGRQRLGSSSTDSPPVRKFHSVFKASCYVLAWFMVFRIAARATAGTPLSEVPRIAVWTSFIACTMYLLWRRLRSKSHAAEYSAAEILEAEDAAVAPPDAWPTCPDCSRRRRTSCPVCETAGTDFARAFMPGPPEGYAAPAGASEKLLVICPLCDEPFAPEFSARCEWCGHKFADGRELPPASQPLEVNARVWFVVAGLALVATAVTAFFFYIARSR